jgi:hypothetical protein
MGGERFDGLTRILASGFDRRAILRVAAAGPSAATFIFRGGGVAAKPNPKPCRSEGRNCSKDDQCCSGYCRNARRVGHGACVACASGIVCGDTCCPENALYGCTDVQGPNGPIVGCLCSEGTRYDREHNECRPCGGTGAKCNGEDDCCEDDGCCGSTCCGAGQSCCGTQCCDNNCCGDHCCPSGRPYCCGGECCAQPCCGDQCCAEGDVCCGGACARFEACTCPPGTACSGDAICTSYGRVATTEGSCCPYPTVAYCCTDSAPGAGDGSTGCCTPDVDCPLDVGCPTGNASAQGGAPQLCCESAGDHPECGPASDCCSSVVEEGGVANVTVNYVPQGKPCDPIWPCFGKCHDGVCVCLDSGDRCNTDLYSACCSGQPCNVAAGTCP